jgi:uracil-DNA glycosylase
MWGGDRDIDVGGLDSLLAWWRDAGVTDCVLNEPNVLSAAQETPVIALTATPSLPTLPADLDAFMANLSLPEQPEHSFTGPFVPPRIIQDAPLLVILDMPDANAPDGEALAPDHLNLLTAMLSCIDLPPAEVSFATLSTRRPAGGLLDEGDLVALALRMGYLIDFARPKLLLLLGDQTSRALCTADAADSNMSLRAVNHSSGTVPAMIMPHIMMLASKARLKAKSWLALRQIPGLLA